MERVGVVRSTYDELSWSIPKVIELAGGLELAGGESVAIKINLCDARTPDTGAITHPVFLDGLLRYLRENFEDLDISVVESDATVVFADQFVRWFGFLPVLERWDAKWVNLSKQEVVNKRIDGRYLKEVPVPALLSRTHLINVPKLKTNLLSTVTCGLKNIFGCLPMVEKSIFHDHLDDVIADVNLAIPSSFTMVDGIVAMGGIRGPAFGVPIEANALVAGKDPVSVDCASARLMGFNPNRVGHIVRAASSGVGTMRYSLQGDTIDPIDVEVSKLDVFYLKIGGYIKRRLQRKFRDSWRNRP